MEMEQDQTPAWEPWDAGQIPQAQESVKTAGGSPFADSPYVIQEPRIGEAYSQPDNGPEGARTYRVGKGTGNIWLGVLAAVMVVLAIVGCCALTAVTLSSRYEQQLAQVRDEMSQELSDLQDQMDAFMNAWGVGTGSADTDADSGFSPAQIYAMNVKSVVAVATQSGSGSGFVITDDGYVVTNYHVVTSATYIHVTTYDEQIHSAKLIGYDSGRDVALLKIDAQGLPFIKFGSSSALSVGDQVLAIGNPLGELTATLTVGVVSAKDRVINTDGAEQNMLQTDAAINSGNSGGPLFNMNGEVVGITTAKYSGFSSSGAAIEGIGFAIPIDDVLSLIETLYRQIREPGAYLGVYVRDVDQTVIDDYGLPAGAYVVSVIEDISAARAGIREKDIIIGIDDHTVTSVDSLGQILSNYKPEDSATVTVLRGGVQLELSITFDAAPVDLNQ